MKVSSRKRRESGARAGCNTWFGGCLGPIPPSRPRLGYCKSDAMSKLSTTLEALNTALENEDFERGFALLEAAYASANLVDKVQLALHSAHLHSLYADGGVEEGLGALKIARSLDFLIERNPLYTALEAELQAYGARESDESAMKRIEQQATTALTGNLLARYHAAAALSLLELNDEVLGVWLSLGWKELPKHLHWRYFAWLGSAYEGIGQLEGAEDAYREAVDHAPRVQQAAMLAEQAALNLSLERFEMAGLLLERAREQMQTDGGQEAQMLTQWHYLRAQAEMGLGRPESAENHILEAVRLETEAGESSYGVTLVHGQVLMALGRSLEALEQLREAVVIASPLDLPYALHELGVALLDLDRILEAKEALRRTLESEEYPFMPEVQADLAEAEYRMGNLHEAEEMAQSALGMGATVTASLVLGAVALEYYHLDEALEHYTRALNESAEGSREWTLGHQMVADILAQQGFSDPANILEHAQKALERTPVSDEWHHTLQGYVTRANEMMAQGRSSRTLN